MKFLEWKYEKNKFVSSGSELTYIKETLTHLYELRMIFYKYFDYKLSLLCADMFEYRCTDVNLKIIVSF